MTDSANHPVASAPDAVPARIGGGPPGPWILLPIGLLILVVCVLRITFNRPDPTSNSSQPIWMPAPLFSGFDAYNQLMRLERYAGRHRIVVCFISKSAGLQDWADLRLLNEKTSQLKQRDIKVVAVTDALPQEIRMAMQEHGSVPFPVVADVNPQQVNAGGVLQIHARWGLVDFRREPPQLRQGVFLVDRRGYVKFREGVPVPEESLEVLLNEVLK